MAKTVKNDEERNRRIKLVGEYYTTMPDASVRSTAKHFSDTEFSISIATVSEYLKVYMKMYPDKSGNLKSILNVRTPKTIKDPLVVERIKKEIKLLKEGYTLEDISKTTGVDYWTVQKDLTTRLEKLNKESYLEIKNILSANSLDNLNNRKK